MVIIIQFRSKAKLKKASETKSLEAVHHTHQENAQMERIRIRIDKRNRVAEIREIEKKVHDNKASCNGAISPERRTRDTYNHGPLRIRFGLGGSPARVLGGDGRG